MGHRQCPLTLFLGHGRLREAKRATGTVCAGASDDKIGHLGVGGLDKWTGDEFEWVALVPPKGLAQFPSQWTAA